MEPVRVPRLFLSYARKDDAPFEERRGSGFVTVLLKHLEEALDDLGPPIPEIFRDMREIDEPASLTRCYVRN